MKRCARFCLLFLFASYSSLFMVNLTSCSHNSSLQSQLRRFTETNVVIPDGLRQMVMRWDSVALNLSVGEAKLVVYVDSVVCSSCRIDQMFDYEEIINYREEIGGGFIPIFLFAPPRTKIDEVLRTLESTQFNYPILLDEAHVFSQANPHLPADSRLHTFLLDKNGKVVLVGDPVNNPPLWELYKTTITTLIENGGTMPDVEKKD